jgi:hypothetical protein
MADRRVFRLCRPLPARRSTCWRCRARAQQALAAAVGVAPRPFRSSRLGELHLEAADLATDCRLGNAEEPPGATETTEVDDVDEILELLQVNATSPPSSRPATWVAPC